MYFVGVIIASFVHAKLSMSTQLSSPVIWVMIAVRTCQTVTMSHSTTPSESTLTAPLYTLTRPSLKGIDETVLLPPGTRFRIQTPDSGPAYPAVPRGPSYVTSQEA